MPFLITTVIQDGAESDAILNLDLCFAFARDSEGHAIALSSGGSRITTGMQFTDLAALVAELTAMELGEPDDDDGGAGIKVTVKP